MSVGTVAKGKRPIRINRKTGEIVVLGSKKRRAA